MSKCYSRIKALEKKLKPGIPTLVVAFSEEEADGEARAGKESHPGEEVLMVIVVRFVEAPTCHPRENDHLKVKPWAQCRHIGSHNED